jgi:DNA mismatch repair protein MutL
VSRVELVTQPAEGPGTRIALDGGRVTAKEPAARAQGTTIEVTGLFHNVPARRKFLKTPQTEGRVMTRAVGAQSLGALGVGFRVVRDGKTVLDVAPAHDFRDRARAIFGAETVGRMVKVSGGREGVEVSGLVAAADFARTRDHQVLLVNGRPVADASLSHAVKEGIGGAIPGGRQVIFALDVRLDPGDVDVNVHPTKREVRFRNKNRVFGAVRDAVAHAVLNTHFDAMGREGVLPWRTSRPDPAAPVVREGAGETGRLPLPLSHPPRPAPVTRITAASGFRGGAPVGGGAGEATQAAGKWAAAQTAAPLTRLRLVGELWGAYLIVEDEGRLLIIDQHAAHERVLYDEIRGAALHPKGIPVQGLLVPLQIELAPGAEPEDAAAVLTELGFSARAGGPDSVLVDGVPGHLSRWGGGEFLRELFASPEGAVKSAEKLRDAVAKSYSCKGAVKFNQRLHREEIEHLLRGLEKTDVPRLCPHGRPIYLEVKRDQIDDRFER